MRVLVVEDERPLARALRRTLEAEGFSVVLVARLRALLRRSSAGPDPSLAVGSPRVEPERRRAWLGEQELHLTARELGLLSYLVAVRRGRWLVVPAVVLAVRMLLDPGAYPYYTAGLVLATILVAVGWRQTRWPWASMGVVVGLYTVWYLGPLTPTDAVLGWLRAVTLLGVLAAPSVLSDVVGAQPAPRLPHPLRVRRRVVVVLPVIAAGHAGAGRTLPPPPALAGHSPVLGKGTWVPGRLDRAARRRSTPRSSGRTPSTRASSRGWRGSAPAPRLPTSWPGRGSRAVTDGRAVPGRRPARLLLPHLAMTLVPKRAMIPAPQEYRQYGVSGSSRRCWVRCDVAGSGVGARGALNRIGTDGCHTLEQRQVPT